MQRPSFSPVVSSDRAISDTRSVFDSSSEDAVIMTARVLDSESAKQLGEPNSRRAFVARAVQERNYSLT